LPKACRNLAADKLSSILLFSYRALNVAVKSDKSLNKHIKENLSNFEVPQMRTGSKKRTNLSLAKKVEAKVEELKKKHPSPSRELFFPDPSKPGDISLIVNEQSVREKLSIHFLPVLHQV
jgi:hypothetical protein